MNGDISRHGRVEQEETQLASPDDNQPELLDRNDHFAANDAVCECRRIQGIEFTRGDSIRAMFVDLNQKDGEKYVKYLERKFSMMASIPASKLTTVTAIARSSSCKLRKPPSWSVLET